VDGTFYTSSTQKGEFPARSAAAVRNHRIEARGELNGQRRKRTARSCWFIANACASPTAGAGKESPLYEIEKFRGTTCQDHDRKRVNGAIKKDVQRDLRKRGGEGGRGEGWMGPALRGRY